MLVKTSDAPQSPLLLLHTYLKPIFHQIYLLEPKGVQTVFYVGRSVTLASQCHFESSHSEHEDLIAAFARNDGAWAEAIMAGHIRRAFHAYTDAHHGLSKDAA